jgi:hypothetical protein
MSIRELRILPPLSFARLGSAPDPMDNYTLEDDPERPFGFRRIKPAETLIVDAETGEICESRIPKKITFKQNGCIRPVAPFLEVFALTEKGVLEPLTLDLLGRNKLDVSGLSWSVSVANRKIVRRTNDKYDLVAAEIGWFSNHAPQQLKGHCKNFISPESFVDFGHVRFIKPTEKFPQIRLRFTPARGLIYGPDESVPPVPDPNPVPEERAIYNHKKAWAGFEVTSKLQNETLPPSLFAIVPPAPSWLNDNKAVSRGYFDDACDGFVEVRLALRDKSFLTAVARISSGPPAVVPDSYFVRSLADDLEQAIHGPKVRDDEPHEVTRARAEDIIRRAYETVRFMNVAVMNGNNFQGRPALLLDSMPEEEAADTERAIRPIMGPGTVDTLAILALHEQVYAALRGGAEPWFLRLLRQPDEVADYTDRGRRKMPALMCGADNSYLALTYRQIDTIRKASTHGVVPPQNRPREPQKLTPRNLSAQLHYAAAGNPVSSRPEAAIANCCPGLELDFRAVWRRMFEGIVLREYDNLVVDIDLDLKDKKKRNLRGHRLLRVNGVCVMTEMKGPATSDVEGSIILTTNLNPDGLAPLEWSNALAKVLHEFKGRTVTCDFSAEESWDQQVRFKEKDETGPKNYVSFEFKIRPFFEKNSALISKTLAEPGELTQGLCSPWQNDYRECSCYYWASARPDYVNVEASPTGLSNGDNWLQKERTGKYVPDDYLDSRLILYDELFLRWEHWLRFQVGGRDVPEENEG